MGLYSAGVQIIAGTDAGIDNCPHDAYLAGLEGLAMVGLPAVEILDAATLRAARALGVDDRTGPIEPGKDADLIAVRGDPRTDISVLNQLELVVARGKEHRPAPHRGRRPAGSAASGPPPGAEPAVAGPAAAAGTLAASGTPAASSTPAASGTPAMLAAPAGPSPR